VGGLMPKFNRHGQITPRIGYSWYDDSRFIVQDCATGVCRIVLSDGTLIDDVGTTLLLGNGRGTYAYIAFTGPIDPTLVAYRDSFGRTRTNFYPCAIGPDGAIAYRRRNRHGTTRSRQTAICSTSGGLTGR
jgi:hypothetical protein